MARDLLDRPDWLRPEIIATEQRIITMADAIWERHIRRPMTEEERCEFDHAMLTCTVGNAPEVRTLELSDPHVQQLFKELMHAVWKRRVWQIRYGERKENDL